MGLLNILFFWTEFFGPWEQKQYQNPAILEEVKETSTFFPDKRGKNYSYIY